MAVKTLLGTKPEVVVNDTDDDDSDKSFTVAGGLWRLMSVYISMVTTSDVGDRKMSLEVQNAGGDVVYQSDSLVVQAASATRQYVFAPGNERATTADGTAIYAPLADLLLSPGMVVRVYDRNAVQAAADDMHVRILAEVH